MHKTITFFQGAFILSGMIIGVGMFGIPFSFARAGFLLGTVELIFLTGIILLYHILYAKVVLATSSPHRLPGYVQIYLGKQAKTLAWFSSFFGIVGALLAYLILGVFFLNTIAQAYLPGLPPWVSLVVLVVLHVVINTFPLKKEARISAVLTLVLIAFITWLIGILLPHVEVGHLGGFHKQYAFLPYGVLLFALSGGVVIPDLITFLGRNSKQTYRAIIIGTLIPAILYFLFAFAIVGVLGVDVTPDAISGLWLIVGEKVILLGSIIGFLATFTAHTALAESFESLLRLDLILSPSATQAVVSGVPLTLYLLGFQNFFPIISVVGACAVGIDSALVVAMYHELEKRTKKKLSVFSYAWKTLIYAVLIFGVLYEVVRIVKG